MTEFSQKGFTSSLVISVLSVAVLVSVIGLTLYSSNTENFSVLTKATAQDDLEEALPAVQKDLGLTVAPALGTDNSVNITASWDWTKIRTELKRQNGKLAKLRITVRKMPYGDYQNNLLSDTNNSKVLPTETITSKTFPNIPVNSGDSYYVQLRAVYTEDGQPGNKVKVIAERVNFKYVRDTFSSSQLGSFWTQAVTSPTSVVALENSKLVAKITPTTGGNGQLARIFRKVDLSKGFSASVKVTNVELPKSNNQLSEATMYVIGSDSNTRKEFVYGPAIVREAQGGALVVTSWLTRGRSTPGLEGINWGKKLPLSNTFPVTLQMNYDGSRISSLWGTTNLDDNLAGSVNPRNGGNINSIVVGAATFAPASSATVDYSNFRIVWVK